MFSRLGPLVLVCTFAGCMTAQPDYQKPAVDLPDAWGSTAGRAPLPAGARWWTLFRDERLTALVEEALANNANVSIAVARVAEVRAQLGVAEADLFPTVAAGFDRSRLQTSQRAGIPMPPGTPSERNDYRAALTASYEIDLWGRLRTAVAAARAELLASEAARDTVRLTLSADVVNLYFSLRALDEQIAATRRIQQNRRDFLALQRGRLAAGMISELEIHQLNGDIAAGDAQLAPLERQRGVGESALALLAGRSPKLVYQARFEYDTTPASAPVQSVPAGLPSDLLLRRPDIAQAEQQLIAANARIAIARVAWFPSITLTGMFGSQSSALTNLFTGPAGIFNFAASVAQPIFSGGRQDAAVAAARAREEQAAQRYRQSVQNAFREVRDALVAQAYTRIQYEAEEKRGAALREAWRVARLRLDNGVGTQLELLDAERGLLASEISRADARRLQNAALADLAKALGGGWE